MNSDNKDLKEYYNQLYTHHNNIPQAQQNEHIKHREIINRNQKYNKTVNGITYTNTLPLIKIKRSGCPECGCKTYSYDYWRGEKVCPQCGLVFEEGIAQQPPNYETYRKPRQGFTWEEKRYLRQQGRYKYPTNTKEWLNNHNNRTIQSLTCQAQLTKKQKYETKYIIDTIGFKKLHSRATKPTIIAGVIRYIQKHEYTQQTLLRYNQGIYKNLLTADDYNIIEKNIEKHFNNINAYEIIKKEKGELMNYE